MLTRIDQVLNPRVFAVNQELPFAEALEAMSEEGVHHLLVLNDSGEAVGVLTLEHKPSSREVATLPTKLMMNTSIVKVPQDFTLRRAIFRLLETRVPCLLVTDSQDQILGIVTTEDILWHLAHLLESEAEEKTIFSAEDRQTIGEIAEKLSLMGI